jgi:predicted metal-dependent phosphoesterase TrpH
MVILPHPYRRKRFPSDELLKRVETIESINARTSEKFNLNAQMLAKELKKPMIAGSDAHFSFELGRAWNIIKNTSVCDEEELRKKISSRAVNMCSKNYSPFMRKTGIILGTVIKRMRTMI